MDTPTFSTPETLLGKIQQAINCHSAENGSDTPDFILAEYLKDCLAVFDKAVNAREKWYGREVMTKCEHVGDILPPP